MFQETFLWLFETFILIYIYIYIYIYKLPKEHLVKILYLVATVDYVS